MRGCVGHALLSLSFIASSCWGTHMRVKPAGCQHLMLAVRWLILLCTSPTCRLLAMKLFISQ
jgi:hypothetical protein